MKPLLNSTSRQRLAQVLGLALIALALHAMLSAVVLVASLVLLQKGITPDLPWISSVQKNLYVRAIRSVWQNQASCVDFDEELIYKPKIGVCQFNNAEFKTTLNFTAEGRFTGKKPAGTGIAVIGDSHAMGWGVQDEETFAAELQRLTGRPVYNLAVASYGTVREILRLEKSGLLDRVDTIIIQYCGNDLDENQRGRINGIAENREKFGKITKARESFGGLLRIIRRTYGFAFSFPFRQIQANLAQPPKATAAGPADDFLPHYQALMAVLEKHADLKSKRILITYNNSYGQRYQTFPAGKDKLLPNVEFIDIGSGPGDYYRFDDHMTPAGHKKTAESLFRALRQ